MGVKELSMPANELSIFFAMANAKRNAGNKIAGNARKNDDKNFF